jgi:hypothetical protein
MGQEIGNPFVSLWSDIQSAETFPARRPLLAHYTSIETLERILASDEMWFSNPLYMNDLEELRFGMSQSAAAFRIHAGIKQACGTEDRYAILLKAFDTHFQEFDQVHAFDTYVLCFSEHDADDTDGMLSMWRGYGSDGRGVAVVIDTSNINVIDTPLFIISNVTYASRPDRLAWIGKKLDEFAVLVKGSGVTDATLPIAAVMLLERMKAFALFTKDRGFREEREWRFVHMRQLDRGHILESMLGYAIGRRGLEPKLKFKVAPIEGITALDLSLEKLIHRIILGPSISNVLTAKTVQRMLEKLGKAGLADKIRASATPFRSHDG